MSDVDLIHMLGDATRHDEFVNPHTSGRIPGGPGMDVTNVIVQAGCLDDLDQKPLSCKFVPPFFG